MGGGAPGPDSDGKKLDNSSNIFLEWKISSLVVSLIGTVGENLSGGIECPGSEGAGGFSCAILFFRSSKIHFAKRIVYGESMAETIYSVCLRMV